MPTALPSAAPAAQHEEFLVGRFPGGFSAHWCGNRALVVTGEKFGIVWVDILTRRQIRISSTWSPPYLSYGCTFDGAWVVYEDNRTAKTDKNFPGVDQGHGGGWDGGVVDLWRYRVGTGRRHRLAVVRSEGGWRAMAPSTYRVLLGTKHRSMISMPSPRWEAFWFADPAWDNPGVVWFRDSSGVIGRNDVAIHVEIFGKNGWARTFFPRLGTPWLIGTDAFKRIYVVFVTEIESGVPERQRLSRCEASPQRLDCTTIFRDLDRRVLVEEVLPSGDVLLRENYAACIRRVKVGQSTGACIVEKNSFETVSAEEVTPDGRWLAFTRYAKPHPGGISLPAHGDVFVVRLDE